jgi:hypothetical protein
MSASLLQFHIKTRWAASEACSETWNFGTSSPSALESTILRRPIRLKNPAPHKKTCHISVAKPNHFREMIGFLILGCSPVGATDYMTVVVCDREFLQLSHHFSLRPLPLTRLKLWF